MRLVRCWPSPLCGCSSQSRAKRRCAGRYDGCGIAACATEVEPQLALRSLLLVIAAVEPTDLLFALDSIPAVLAVTRNPWIAFTSNIFAVLGLRSLYFALASMLDRLHLLHYGLACILGFVAFKMLAAQWITIPASWSLLVIVGILVVFTILSKALPAENPGQPA